MTTTVTVLPTIPKYRYVFTCPRCKSHIYYKIAVGGALRFGGKTHGLTYFWVCGYCQKVLKLEEDDAL